VVLLMAASANAGIKVEVDGAVLRRAGSDVVLGSGDPVHIQFDGDAAALVLPGDTPASTLAPITQQHTIRIFDESVYDESTGTTNLPVSDIGKVLIEGRITSPTPPRIFLSVKGAPGTITSPETPIVDRGAVNFGGPATDPDAGLTIRNPADAGDRSLAKALLLGVAITGELSGHVTAGRVIRVQASDPASASGLVSASITAIAGDDPVPSSLQFRAVETIAAKVGITGDISAVGSVDPGTGGVLVPASIAKIVVGPIDTNVGIKGNILAETGHIGAIFSTGPIAAASGSPRLRIYAANGIEQVRIISEADANGADFPPAGLVKDIDADIRANRRYTITPLLSTFPAPTHFQADPKADAAIYKIQTRGSIRGSIKAGNIAFNPDITGHSGVLALGDIDASIDVDLNVENADIIGANIHGPITVGMKMKGSVVAVGSPPGTGTINSVTVGYNPAPPQVYAETFVPGFIGNDNPPLQASLAEPLDQYTMDDWITYLEASVLFPPGLDGGALDSVIRAASIGEVKLRAMTVLYNQYARRFPDDPISTKHFAPRIEAPTVGTLQIDDLREGVVWSGRVDYNEDGSINDPSPLSPYAAVTGSVTLGCVSRRSALWLRDVPLLTGTGSMRGLLTMPELPAGSTVRLVSLGDPTVSCGSSPYGDTIFEYGQAQPHYRTFTDGIDHGTIDIKALQGLKGQIILNAQDDITPATDAWKGRANVRVATTGTLQRVALARYSPTDPDLRPVTAAPRYNVKPADLGGGSAGLVPYNFHPEGCDPRMPRTTTGKAVARQQQLADNGVGLRWYGPVENAANAFVVTYQDEDDNTVDATDLFLFAVDSANPRFVRMRLAPVPGGGNPLIHFHERFTKDVVFTVTTMTTGSSALRCRKADLIAPANTMNIPVLDGTYRFSTIFDCNANSIDDADDIAAMASLDCNHDGYIDDCQVVDNLLPAEKQLQDTYTDNNQNSGHPDGIPDCCQCHVPHTTDGGFCRGDQQTVCLCVGNADFNHMNGVDLLDIFAFLNAWFANDPSADYNGNHVVSGDLNDIFAFLTDWFNGCGGP
jgi:hypothetical protein